MTPKQVLKHFGTDNRAAQSMGITVQTVRKWVKNGCIPAWSQKAIAWDTNGELKPDSKGK